MENPGSFQVIDAHLHCGCQNVHRPWEGVRGRLLAAGIRGAGLIPPVEDVYDRYDPNFTDTPAWQATRRRAHRYLLGLTDPEIEIFPYFFRLERLRLGGAGGGVCGHQVAPPRR
ncbi:MAG: hypothetical protein WHT07_02445 [Desulfobaccales bacterium]